MLHDFLLKNENEILASAARKSLPLSGARPSSDQLKLGLPIFYKQLMNALRFGASEAGANLPIGDKEAMAIAARNNDESAIAKASDHPHDFQVAESAGAHGVELLRLGYTLSHVVHAYGSMCQAITEMAINKRLEITADEFHDLNRCLDVAIAGAVTEFQGLRNTQENTREVQHLGFLAHELRNALGSVTMSLALIKDGTVGFRGSVGVVLDKGLKRIEELIDRSLTEVRMKVDPNVRLERIQLFQLVDQIVVTGEIEARAKNQTLQIKVDPSLVIEGDQQLIYSAVSNLIQNALKFTRHGGTIQVRGSSFQDNIALEVEDECGGLTDEKINLFKPFEQQNENRQGLGLGLTIAQRALALNKGSIDVRNLPGKGCIFKITFSNIPTGV